MSPPRVLLVEDNQVYRDSLAFLLGRRDEVVLVGAVATGSEAAAACVDLGVDVAVVDFRLPDVGGADVAEAVRHRSPTTSIVFLSASAGAEETDAARRLGAALVRKDEGVDPLLAAIQAARPPA